MVFSRHGSQVTQPLRKAFISSLPAVECLVVTVEVGSMDRRELKLQGFSSASSVVLRLLLVTLENTGIQSAFLRWKNLEKRIKVLLSRFF